MTFIQRKPTLTEQSIAKSLTEQGFPEPLATALTFRKMMSSNQVYAQHSLLHYREMMGIDLMSEKLAAAIEAKEKIVVVADYDCDGATACAVGVAGLRALGANVDFIVPNRFVHGYGLTPSVVEMAIQVYNPKWIVTVDNGIASHAGVDFAKSKGVGVLITDHHLPADTVPNADAIVNPNQKGCTFGSKNLAGCGVIYYVVAATRDVLRNKYPENHYPNMVEFLDLVALGTVADLVKMDDNNRWLVSKGIQRIKEGLARPGIVALFNVANKKITSVVSQDFGFAIAPRINAAGRLDDMSIGIQCLLTQNPEEAEALASKLNEINLRRRAIESDMKSVASYQVQAEIEGEERFTHVLYDSSFNEGVVGIVAGRIKEQEGVPVFVFADSSEEGMIKGSGRSIPEIHLRDTLDILFKKFPAKISRFGGHAMAAGISLKKSDFIWFKESFEQEVASQLNFKKPNQNIVIDYHLDSKYLNLDFLESVESVVWGNGFSAPIWSATFKVIEIVWCGNNGQTHTKLTLLSDDLMLDAIWFNEKKAFPVGSEHSLVFTLGKNVFRGNVSLQAQILGVR